MTTLFSKNIVKVFSQKVFLSFAFLFLSVPTVNAEVNKALPNIVILYADDMGSGNLTNLKKKFKDSYGQFRQVSIARHEFY